MKKILFTTLLISFAILTQAQEVKIEEKNNEKKDELYVKLKEGQNPDVYIDDKKYDAKILELLDQDKIKSVTVIKDEQAKKEYNAPNGVILIKTKKEGGAKIVFREQKNSGKGYPKIIIDGELSSQEKLEKISPDDIHSIDVIKDETALKDYNAPNGVILITTKKKHKKKK